MSSPESSLWLIMRSTRKLKCPFMSQQSSIGVLAVQVVFMPFIREPNFLSGNRYNYIIVSVNRYLCDAEGETMNCDSTCGRNYLTKEEKVERLKEYKKTLDLESQGVGERIAELQQ